jgi:hypothetical protein
LTRFKNTKLGGRAVLGNVNPPVKLTKLAVHVLQRLPFSLFPSLFE